jgi:HSP20 family molecular chaperone IbpA
MPLPARRHPVSARFPDLLDWLESPWPAVLPFGSAQTFRIEDYTEDGKYMIRAELPDLDPEKDIEVTVEPRTLTIHAERHEETRQDRHSEFRYGSLTRTVRLPEDADPDMITASYGKGILKVIVPVPEEEKSAARRITVAHAS